jgi:hypothetical protein
MAKPLNAVIRTFSCSPPFSSARLAGSSLGVVAAIAIVVAGVALVVISSNFFLVFGMLGIGLGLLVISGYGLAVSLRKKNPETASSPSLLSTSSQSPEGGSPAVVASTSLGKNPAMIAPDGLVNLEKILNIFQTGRVTVQGSVLETHNEFDRYLSPNERALNRLRDLFKAMPEPQHPGTLLSVGTERSFFLWLLTPKTWRRCLVVQDVNPKVKAYLDFAMLLLHIALNREECLQLAQLPGGSMDENVCRQRVNELQVKIQSSDMSGDKKKYYLTDDRLMSFARIYYRSNSNLSCSDHWSSLKENECVNYWKSDDLFKELKDAVTAGCIVTSVRSIDDSGLLRPYQVISAIPPTVLADVSNVSTYHILDFLYDVQIIFTQQRREDWDYFYFKYEVLTDDERREIDGLFEQIFGDPPPGFKPEEWRLDGLRNTSFFKEELHSSGTSKVIQCSYSKAVLGAVRKYNQKYIYTIPGAHTRVDVKKLMLLTNNPFTQHMEAVCGDPLFVSFLPAVIEACFAANMYEGMLRFARVPTWKETIAAYVAQHASSDGERLLKNLQDPSVRDGFIRELGHEDFEKMLKVIRLGDSCEDLALPNSMSGGL